MEVKQNVYVKQRADGSVIALFDHFKRADDFAEILDSAPSKDLTAFLVAYREDQWEAMRAAAVDRDELHATWNEWNEEGKKHLAQLKARGVPYIWMPFDVEKCQQYCKERGVPNNVQNRIQSARLQYETEHPGDGSLVIAKSF